MRDDEQPKTWSDFCSEYDPNMWSPKGSVYQHTFNCDCATCEGSTIEVNE